jgi:hypothetical protein
MVEHIALCISERSRVQITARIPANLTGKIKSFGDVAPCSQVEVDRCFRGAYCLHHRRDVEGSTHLWNVGQLQRDYTALLPRRLWTSYSPPQESEISQPWLTPWSKNPKVHHRTHKSPPPVPVLSQSNPIHPPPPANLPKIHSDPIFQPTPWSSHLSFSFGLSHQNIVHFSLLSHACHMSRPPHSPWLDLPNDIWGWVQIMKLLTVSQPWQWFCFWFLAFPLNNCQDIIS